MTSTGGAADRRPSVVILGAGRAGCSLHAALDAFGYDNLRLWTRSESTAHAAQADGFDVEHQAPSDSVHDALPADVGDADVVFLAVADPAVGPLAARLAASGLARPGRVFAHLAGALDLRPLDPLREAGASTGSVHPLASLATRRSPLSGFAAAIEASDAKAHALLSRVATDAGLVPFDAPADRAKHHAACCIVGNFPQVLLEAATRVLVSEGIEPDVARRALGPLLVGAARNALEKGPAAGLTGPVSRGDATTVSRHLEALTAIPAVEPLYRDATRIAVDLARANGVDASAVAVLLDGDD